MLASFSARWLPTLGLLTLLGSACQRQAASAAADCIDPANVKPDGICTMDYAPVCGCDGKTYSNSCQADKAGVRAYQTGPCPSK